MSAAPLFRFTCDRCKHEDEKPMQSTANRLHPPEGWATIRIGIDDGAMPQHLCPDCNVSFEQFMRNTTAYPKEHEE